MIYVLMYYNTRGSLALERRGLCLHCSFCFILFCTLSFVLDLFFRNLDDLPKLPVVIFTWDYNDSFTSALEFLSY